MSTFGSTSLPMDVMNRMDPMDVPELLGRLNDAGEQAAGYPLIDEFEEYIDLVGTDVLHGWRGGWESVDCFEGVDSLFADAFANAFRVLVLSPQCASGEDSDSVSRETAHCGDVFRGTGISGGSWQWERTGRIVGWSVHVYPVSSGFDLLGDMGRRQSPIFAGTAGRRFPTASGALECVESILGAFQGVDSLESERRAVRVIVRAMEAPLNGASQAPAAFPGPLASGGVHG